MAKASATFYALRALAKGGKPPLDSLLAPFGRCACLKPPFSGIVKLGDSVAGGDVLRRLLSQILVERLAPAGKSCAVMLWRERL